MFAQIAGSVVSAVPQVGGAVPAEGIFGAINSFSAEAQGAISSVLVVAGIVIALLISLNKRNVPGVIMGIVVGGLIAGLGVLVGVFSNMAKEEFASPAQVEDVAIVQVVEGADGGLV
ncbi:MULTISPECIES: hypothetical protein [Paenarthrobacter]|uniref:Uncharacterized protein n=1 Tax=Paenarthrobacter ureafaciens TaxID=37931 RepID=A0AAX3EQ51_PAEUR|nr:MULTISPECIES: hypothetical protein [Paenarthrobacter]MDO5867077.1 hypothetical protein [Paenarthrobacter sp. SD-2]MDO5878246.1 hypothetical protein [Paenarthrobacter sp. SD-1]UYV95518.1 hypothetical protein NL395_23120 [Paenarthrobacter ureafaciens]UYW00119.1 hypothetical protein NL394_23505 [Paenarthrobacter ureafaciens]